MQRIEHNAIHACSSVQNNKINIFPVCTDLSQLILKAAETPIQSPHTYRIQPARVAEISKKESNSYLDIINPEKKQSGYESHIALYITLLTKKTKQELQAAKGKPDLEEALLAAYREEVGSIIYLADKDLERTAGILKCDSFRKSRQRVNQAIDEDFKTISQQIDKFYIAQQQSLCSSLPISHSIRMTITLAQILITKHSFFNAMLVPKAIRHFIPEKIQMTSSGKQDMREPYKKRIEDVLLTLSDASIKDEGPFSDIQARFRSITPPLEQNQQAHFRSSLMIKATLGMNKNDQITQRDCAVTVLFHLLGWSRQAETGSCFAEWLQIQILAERLDIAFSDAENLITYGALFRNVNEIKEAFEFSPVLPYSADMTAFSVDPSGIIYNSDSPGFFSKFVNFLYTSKPQPIHFWETPAYQAVISIWGIPQDEQASFFQKVLNKLASSPTLSASCTMNDLIIISAEIWCEQQSLPRNEVKQAYKELLITGNYAAESLEHNAIQRAWIDAAATFQEATGTEPRIFSNAIKNSTLKTITDLVTGVDKSSDLFLKIQEQLGNRLLNMTKIQYSMADLEPKKKKCFGFYILHERDLLEKPGTIDSGTPINSPKKFQNFALKALDQVILETDIRKNINDQNTRIFKAFKTAIKSTNFIPTVENEFLSYVSSPFVQGLTQYPWKFWDGGYLETTYQVCMNTSLNPNESAIVYPTQVMDLCNWYLNGLYNYCKSHDDWEFKNAPPYMSGSMQGHDFNWLIGDQSTIPLLTYMKENNCNAETAFNALLLPAAQIIYNLKISPPFHQSLFASTKHTIESKVDRQKLSNESLASLYQELDILEKKMPEHILSHSIGGVCNEILNITNQKITNPEIQQLLALEMTAFVAKNISGAHFQEWMAPTLLAADSNWQDDSGAELRRICFFMAISPVTLQPFIGEINDLKTRTPKFNPLPNFSDYYAMHHLVLKGIPNPSL